MIGCSGCDNVLVALHNEMNSLSKNTPEGCSSIEREAFRRWRVSMLQSILDRAFTRAEYLIARKA